MKKTQQVIPYIIFICGSMWIFMIPVANADELWNYHFSKAIAAGLLPYVEVSMVPTPLAAVFAAMIFRILGDGLFIYRCLSVLLCFGCISLFYILAKEFLQGKITAFLVCFAVLVVNVGQFIYSYNTLMLFCVLLIFLLQKRLEEAGDQAVKTKLLIILGVLSGCLPIIKQNTGGALFLVYCLVCICEIMKRNEQRKNYIMSLIVSICPCVLFFIHLVLSKSVAAFIDYAVLGIRTFSHRIYPWQYMLLSPINFLIGVMVFVTVLFLLYQVCIKKNSDILVCSYVIYALVWFGMVSFPLFDEQHLFLGVQALLIALIAIVHKSEKWKDAMVYASTLVASFGLMIGIITMPDYSQIKYSELPNFEGILLYKTMESEIIEIDDYIRGQQDIGREVYMAYEYACLYHIPMDVYQKNWDLLLKGNLGTKTMEELLSLPENAVILVKTEGYAVNRQAYVELMEYVREHYTCIDEVNDFEVYRKN